MSMREAASAADKLGSFIELITRAQTVLRAAASAEQAEQDQKGRIEKLVKDEALASLNLDGAVSRLAAAEQRVADALESSKTILAETTATASKIIADAKEAARAVSDDANVRLQSAKHKQQVADDMVAEAMKRRDALQSESNEYLTKIEAAKEAARKAFG